VSVLACQRKRQWLSASWSRVAYQLYFAPEREQSIDYVYIYAPKVYKCRCIYYVYSQNSHVRVNIIANIHIEFTCVCVYFGVYSHGVYMCVCTCFRICKQRCTQNSHVYVYMVTYIHRESIRGYVKMSIYTPSVHMYLCIYLRLWAQSSNIHVGVYVFTCRHAEFGCGDVRAYMPA